MPEPRPARLAVVDDNRDDLLLARLAFRRAGLALEFEAFRSGESFLEAMGARTGEALPDLALVDLNLPLMRGSEVIRRARRAPWSAAMALGVCSGSADPADRSACQAAGADFFLPKPVDARTIAAICAALPAFRLDGAESARTLLVGTSPERGGAA